MKLSRIAIGGAAGMMGLGLIGVGAHAAFTTTTQSHQQVTAGTLTVVLTSAAAASGNGTRSLTLNASLNNGSTFTTGTIPVTIVNEGSLAANFIYGSSSVTYTTGNAADTALANELQICITGTPSNVLYNGPLITGFTHALAGTVPIGGTRHDHVNIYAGNVTTACGSGTQGTAPAVSGTSTSASLNNTAEGGTVTVTYTLTYQA